LNIFKRPLTAAQIKTKAIELGADLVGIADGANVDTSHITDHDGGRVIVLATRVQAGSTITRPPSWSVMWLVSTVFPSAIPTRSAPSSRAFSLISRAVSFRLKMFIPFLSLSAAS